MKALPSCLCSSTVPFIQCWEELWNVFVWKKQNKNRKLDGLMHVMIHSHLESSVLEFLSIWSVSSRIQQQSRPRIRLCHEHVMCFDFCGCVFDLSRARRTGKRERAGQSCPFKALRSGPCVNGRRLEATCLLGLWSRASRGARVCVASLRGWGLRPLRQGSLRSLLQIFSDPCSGFRVCTARDSDPTPQSLGRTGVSSSLPHLETSHPTAWQVPQKTPGQAQGD